MTRHQRRSTVALLGAIAVLGVTCGADDTTDDTESSAASATTVTTSTTAVAAETVVETVVETAVPAPMTIEALCDPLDETIREIVGSDVGTDHFDLFADHADTPHIRCEWSMTPDVPEARIVYWSSPEAWQSSVDRGGTTIDGIEAEHVYDSGSLSIHAATGWTINVFLFRGGPLALDEPEPITAIGLAALEAAT